MKSKSSLYWSILAPLTTITVLPFVISCSQSRYATTDIGGLKNEFNPDSDYNDQLIAKAKAIRAGNDQKAKELLKAKTILLAAAGSHNDYSFNQSAWEAISKFSIEVGMDDNTYFETKSISDAEQTDAYDYAMAKGFKFWILTGFYQEGLLGRWLIKGNNLERFLKNKIVVLTVDWYPGDQPKVDPDNVDPVKLAFEKITGHVFALNFRTQEAAFVASYAAAQLLNEINQDDPQKYQSEKTLFNSFAGGDFSGATNFNYGFYEGMRQFNQDMKMGLINKTNINPYFIRSTSISSQAPVELKTGFVLTNDVKATIERQVAGFSDQPAPQVIFPVAGSLIGATIDRIKAAKNGQWIIGVDTDQSKTFANDQQLILTSVEKKISISVYKALITLYGLNYNDDVNLLDKDYQFDDDRLISKNHQAFNFNTVGGYDKKAVGLSQSTLDYSLVFKNKKDDDGKPLTYAKRYDQISKSVEEKFFGNQGRFNQDSNTNTNGLKPDESTIQNYQLAIGKEWDAIKAKDYGLNGQHWNNLAERNQAVARNIEKIMALKNVLFGYMSADNQENYFAPIVDQINKIK